MGKKNSRETSLTPSWAESLSPDEHRAMVKARKHAKELRDYYSHLVSFVLVNVFLFALDVVTGPGWWFYFVTLAWGMGLAFHTWSTFGERRFDEQWEERKTRQLLQRQFNVSGRPEGAAMPGDTGVRIGKSDGPPPSAGIPDDIQQLIARGQTEVDQVRFVARKITRATVRDRALGICATADHIIGALGDGSGDPAQARTFLDRYLAPTRTIVERYERLSARGIAAAEPTLRRVETHDLPLIDRRLRELFERLHQGDLIDLQVASEMLAFELDEGAPSSAEGLNNEDAVEIARVKRADPTPTR